ncbi:MAG: hypothetical protein H0W83_05525 [Planctomycetes bacterium]|nr:hypothetical protein [Planctomycetota bacterium]
MAFVQPRKATGEPWVGKQRYLQAWGSFIHALVDRYKGTVKHWEIENEPNADYTPEEYAELLQIACDHARRADPQAKIIAFSGGGFQPDFYERVLKRIDPTQIDACSVHLYVGNSAPEFAAFAQLPKRLGKPAWNTETGTTCPTFFTTLPEYEELRRADHWQKLQSKIRIQTIGTAHNYLLSLSVGGMEKYFHYFGRFVNSGPSQPTSRFGSGKEITEFDGGLRANGVALCIASHVLDGAAYHGPLALDERLQVHLFRKDGGTVGFLWGRSEQPLLLGQAGSVSFRDIMGNPIAGASLKVTDSPIYLRSDDPPDLCAATLALSTLAPAR